MASHVVQKRPQKILQKKVKYPLVNWSSIESESLQQDNDTKHMSHSTK